VRNGGDNTLKMYFYKWAELIYQLTKHCISRYGLTEIEGWYWEVWNEPNINYWKGSMEEYFKMYDFASRALKKACPNAKIGGPHTTSPRDKNGVSVMVWNYHDDDLPAKASQVRINISGLASSKVLVHEYLIDKENSNSYEVWKKMGSPQNPTPEQYETLEDAGVLKMLSSPFRADAKNGVINLSLNLPGQGVSFFRLTWQKV
jgi:beta-xylosidase